MGLLSFIHLLEQWSSTDYENPFAQEDSEDMKMSFEDCCHANNQMHELRGEKAYSCYAAGDTVKYRLEVYFSCIDIIVWPLWALSMVLKYDSGPALYM